VPHAAPSPPPRCSSSSPGGACAAPSPAPWQPPVVLSPLPLEVRGGEYKGQGGGRREEARGGLAAATRSTRASCGWGRERGTWVAAAAEEDALAIGLGFHWCRFCPIFPQLNQSYCATWPNRWSQNKANAQASHDARLAWIAPESAMGSHRSYL
jgi:hypothetical protein